MSINQDDVIDLNTFNNDTLQKRAPRAFVSYFFPQTEASPQIPTFIPLSWNKKITEYMQFGFYPTIGFYTILLARTLRSQAFAPPPNSSQDSISPS